jgi:hypothetical protein
VVIASIVGEKFLKESGLKTLSGRKNSREHHDELRARGLAVAQGTLVALIEDCGIAAKTGCSSFPGLQGMADWRIEKRKTPGSLAAGVDWLCADRGARGGILRADSVAGSTLFCASSLDNESGFNTQVGTGRNAAGIVAGAGDDADCSGDCAGDSLSLPFFSGQRIGHIQSLILAAILIIVGFQVLMIGLLSDLLSLNRRMSEEALYRVRRLEYAAGEGADAAAKKP